MKTFKAPNIKKHHVCTALTVIYHLLFVSGSTLGIGRYIARVEAIEKTAVAQVDRAEALAAKAQAALDESKATEAKLEQTITGLEKQLDSVKDTCSKVKKPF